MCIAHQMPTYLPGSTHDTSPSTFGSFRFRIRLEFSNAAAFGAICTVRHGVLNGVRVLTRMPSDHGVRLVRKMPGRRWSSTYDA